MTTLLSIFRTRRHSWIGCTPPTNNERRATWASKYYGEGRHNRLKKPRVRVKPRIRIVL